MGWFELLKTQGAVLSGAAYGGEGNEGTDALFNIKFGEGLEEEDWEEWMRGKERK
mgnify:CR=1 FL=1|tara:strand:+ start:301 stop:465 length:165 start_codon:yes stop_codon:yes gene_type:complete